jgi:ABC-type nitrate/sulfonate/bicarbonate transport system permease component
MRRLRTALPPLRGLLPLAVFLVAWELIQRGPSPYFPPPSLWWASFVRLAHAGTLSDALFETLSTIMLGLLIASALGSAIGIALGLSRPMRRALEPTLEFCRAVPPPVVVPVAVLFLGYEESLKLLVVTWAAIWPILLNTTSATMHIESLLMDVARSFQLTTAATIRKIIIPAVLPAILLGIRIAVPLAIIVTLLVEMLTLLPGVGAMIIQAQRNFQSADVYALLVLIGLLGFVLNNAFAILEALLLSRFPSRAADL